jgi:hypothetical protein
MSRDRGTGTATDGTGVGLDTRARVVTLIVVFAVAVGVTLTYLVLARGERREALRAAPAQETISVASVQSVPRIVFRNTAVGPNQGRVAMVPLADPSSERAITDESCERVYATKARIICLASEAGLVTIHSASVLTFGGSPQRLDLVGIPSRARLSPDASLAATTSFVSGDSYDVQGFSTRTVITPLGGESINLEDLRLVHRGRTITPTDRNYWGVTFADDGDTFYVTVAFKGGNWLASGSLRTRTVTTLRSDAECPSLSADGSRVAYKKSQGRPAGDWRIAVLDLETGEETLLAGSRSVDDQVEWLDDARIIYGMPREARASMAETDVWVVPADGSGTPSLLVRDAWSPAVVR